MQYMPLPMDRWALLKLLREVFTQVLAEGSVALSYTSLLVYLENHPIIQVLSRFGTIRLEPLLTNQLLGGMILQV